MSFRRISVAGRGTVACLLGLAVVLALAATGDAQVFSNQRSVGGVAIGVDVDGMMRSPTAAELQQLAARLSEQLDEVPDGMNDRCDLRRVSLRRLDAVLAECAATGKEVPDAVRYLAGLQQVRYVLVYPQRQDIVLAGPAEGWKVGERGTVVGVSTGRPVLLLDDLLVALRAVSNPRPSVISCSIDPSAEGRARLQNLARRLPTVTNPRQTAAVIERTLGPQRISISGVPETSHFAQAMVAADYRMKQIGMGVEPAPVTGLPSFLAMLRSSGQSSRNMMPRWWLEPDYGAILSDEKGLAFEITGAGVKTMTENDFIDAQGNRQGSGKSDPVSQKWADNMTRRYEDLAVADPAFGQLQNCMDLAVAATLIARKQLLVKAGCELPMLMAGQASVRFHAPREVASRAAMMRKTRGWLVACGGVQINPWAIVETTEQSDSLAAVRRSATMSDDAPWWSN